MLRPTKNIVGLITSRVILGTLVLSLPIVTIVLVAHSKEALGVIDVSCSPSGCEDYAEDMAVEVEMSCDCGEDDPQPDGYVYVWTYESCEEEEIEPTINEAWANSGQDSIAATAISYFDRHTIAMAVSTFNCTWGEGYESSDEYGCDYWYW